MPIEPDNIPVAECRPAAGAREVKPIHVEMLARSIADAGLIQPIVVRRFPPGYEVIAGMHRLSAFKYLGRDEIPAIIRTDDDLHAELALIDENLIRNELSPAERAIAISRRKAIYEALHPETAHGGDRKSSRQVGDLIEPAKPVTEAAERFTKATADATGQSERTVQREAQRGEDIGEDVLTRVVGTSLDKGEELDALARLSPEKRDEVIERAQAGDKVSAKVEVKKERRSDKEQDLARKQAALPSKRYGVIYADPEWRFEVYSRETGMDRAADNHYPTSATDAICARPVKDIAADDCVLFLWATAPMLPDALKVMAAWGFTYKSQTIWNKDRLGTGYWFRNKHELLLVGTRGNVPAPAMGTQWPSVIDAPVGKHSEKPDKFYELIESYFPSLPKIELNARRARSGWESWGNEAPVESCNQSTGEITQSEARHTTPPAASPEPAAVESAAPAAGSPISERTEASSSSEPSSGAAPHSEAPHTGIGSETCAGCEADPAGEGANALATNSDIDLDIPEFLRRNADNSVPSVPVASPREAQSGISGEAGG